METVEGTLGKEGNRCPFISCHGARMGFIAALEGIQIALYILPPRFGYVHRIGRVTAVFFCLRHAKRCGVLQVLLGRHEDFTPIVAAVGLMGKVLFLRIAFLGGAEGYFLHHFIQKQNIHSTVGLIR